MPGLDRIKALWRHRRHQRKLRGFSSASEIFSHIYATNAWGSQESASSLGSTHSHTKNLRRKLPDVLQLTKATEILDAPCGNFSWFRYVDLPPGVRYTGADIVPALIEANQKTFGDADKTLIWNRRCGQINRKPVAVPQ